MTNSAYACICPFSLFPLSNFSNSFAILIVHLQHAYINVHEWPLLFRVTKVILFCQKCFWNQNFFQFNGSIFTKHTLLLHLHFHYYNNCSLTFTYFNSINHHCHCCSFQQFQIRIFPNLNISIYPIEKYSIEYN